MRTIKTCLLVTTIFLMSEVVRGEDKIQSQPVTFDTTMPAIEVSHQPLEKVLNEIKSKLPGFNFSISRINVPHEYPQLPEMTLENVSISQFAQLVQSEIPGVTIKQSQRSTEVLFTVEVCPGADSVAKPDVQVFGLSEIIAYRALLIKGDGDHVKQATADVLSLIQSALDEDESTPVKAQMKLHPATQVLICKLLPNQVAIVDQVLKALQPSETEHRRVIDESQPDSDLVIKGLTRQVSPTTEPATQPKK